MASKPNRDYGKKPQDWQEGFDAWKKKYAPHDSGYDYDLFGAYLSGLRPDPKTGHFPDTFKKPNHPTFSDESIYSNRETPGGHWYRENGQDVFKKFGPRMNPRRR